MSMLFLTQDNYGGTYKLTSSVRLNGVDCGRVLRHSHSTVADESLWKNCLKSAVKLCAAWRRRIPMAEIGPAPPTAASQTMISYSASSSGVEIVNRS
ncbi:hypothetical protein PC123_g8605 [Phytophthora cactorum]|nr:hypothetical protein PC123_g8605 [Phytophthora cactorum]